MTARVNLLPASYAERIADRRRSGLTVCVLVVVVVLLALFGLAQGRQLSEAEQRRDLERARNAELQARRGKLASVRQLADGIVGRERLLAAAMGTQVSWAGVLSRLSLALPPGASLTSLTAESTTPVFGTTPPLADRRSVIGSTTLNGYSVEKLTPGVERVLQLLATVKGLSEPRLKVGSASMIGDRPVTTFEGSTFLDTGALTARYVKGLPADSHVDVPLIGRGVPGTATAPIPAGASK